MKIKLIFYILIYVPVNLFSQDTLPSHATIRKTKSGIYKKWEEFISNNPSITDSFTVVTNYSLTNKGDTINIGSTFKFLDSTIKRKRVLGFFDGKQLYIKDVFNNGLITILTNKQKFIRFDHIGRFPFTTLTRKTFFLGGGAIPLLIGVLDAAISHPQNEIWYVNKNGVFLQATPQSIGFLIRNEKDFIADFSSELKLTNEVLKKYIIKMNERYPL